MNTNPYVEADLTVCRTAISAALARGYKASLYSGGEWVVPQTDNLERLTSALRTSSDEKVVFRDGKDAQVGWLHFVYGSRPHVIVDRTHNPVMDAICREALGGAY